MRGSGPVTPRSCADRRSVTGGPDAAGTARARRAGPPKAGARRGERRTRRRVAAPLDLTTTQLGNGSAHLRQHITRGMRVRCNTATCTDGTSHCIDDTRGAGIIRQSGPQAGPCLAGQRLAHEIQHSKHRHPGPIGRTVKQYVAAPARTPAVASAQRMHTGSSQFVEAPPRRLPSPPLHVICIQTIALSAQFVVTRMPVRHYSCSPTGSYVSGGTAPSLSQAAKACPA
jgi:hypothetical protein